MNNVERRGGLWKTAIRSVLGFLLLMGGCRTISSGGVPTIEAEIRMDGQAQWGVEVFPLDDLPGRLKSEGAGQSTAVFLEVPAEMPAARISALDRDLRKAGFQKIIYKRPRKADAAVHPKGSIR